MEAMDKIIENAARRYNSKILYCNQGRRQKICQEGGAKHQNISGGWVTGKTFQQIFFVGISLFSNTFRENLSNKKSN